MINIVKDIFSGGKVQNIVNVLMAAFDNSLRFYLIYLNPMRSVDLYGFRQLNENKFACERVNLQSGPQYQINQFEIRSLLRKTVLDPGSLL